MSTTPVDIARPRRSVTANGTASAPFATAPALASATKLEKSPPQVACAKALAGRVSAASAAARNVGLYASTGDYICFLDDDDVFLPK